MILSIDIGNTLTKIALMENGEVEKEWKVSKDGLRACLADIQEVQGKDIQAVGWINVNKDVEVGDDIGAWKVELFPINAQTSFPIDNAYKTPSTLGTDRIVAVIGAQQMAEGGVLVVDAGTALTYDFADENGTYHGGGIAPGMAMRFRALNEFTARLPLLHKVESPPLIGQSTAQSIESGVINGMIAEINGVIEQYRNSQSGKLSVILTGGDASFFEKRLKNINFASSNLIHLGIYHILTHLRNT